MLRLKPSELTLTPDDVDETLRRMASRQQSRALAAGAQGQRRTRPSGQPPPRLVPGPQRSVKDAIAHLGNIPPLPPQQAIVAHIDDEPDGFDETLVEPAQLAESSPDPISLPNRSGHLASASPAAKAAPAQPSSRLPFRLGRSHRRRSSGQEPTSSPRQQTADFEGHLFEPPSLPTETNNAAGPATPKRIRQRSESISGSSSTRQRSPPASPITLCGGASRHQRNRVLSIGQEAFHAPSPLRHAQQASPPYSPEGNSSYPDDQRPLVHLQDHFVDKQDPAPRRVDSSTLAEAGEFMNASTHAFSEIVPHAPRTEPCRRTSQPRFHSRSRSSNEVPPSRLFVPASSSPRTSPGGGDVFWTASGFAPEHSARYRASGRARQHSSEMSNASLAYSCYELHDTRQSSGEESTQGSLSQSQHDGAVASRRTSRGTYRSFRLSDGQPFHPVNEPSSCPFPMRGSPDQQSASPLSAEPYGRPSAGHLDKRFQQNIHRHVSSESSSREVLGDAITATIEERASPLDVLGAQLERASHHFGEQYGRPYRRSHPESAHSAHRSAGPGISPYEQHQFVYGTSSSTFGQSSSMLGQPQTIFGPPMAMADDPYTRGVSANVGRSNGSTVHSTSAQPFNIPVAARTYARSTHLGRISQRSSENAPVGSSGRERNAVWTSQVQDHVSAFEQMQNAAQSR